MNSFHEEIEFSRTFISILYWFRRIVYKRIRGNQTIEVESVFEVSKKPNYSLTRLAP